MQDYLVILRGFCYIQPLYNEVPLYQGRKTKKNKELGPAKLPCYKRVLLYPTFL